MRLYTLLVTLWLFSVTAFAQTDSLEILAPVVNAFTGELIEDGEGEALLPDSTFVSKASFVYNVDNGVRTVSFFACKVPKEGKYLLHVVHKDYFPVYTLATVRASKRGGGYVILSEKLKLRKRPKPLDENQLGEAVVTATKIKMVMKGDTIVYNADAFQLSQGSMLDALIEQLPGAELKENGVITVNGRVVSSLLVNGKDFFRGDPKIALENLPAYMVNQVKVYEEESDLEKMTGIKETERALVMDVNLKKQCSIGWIANAEAGYGTEDKWLGRVFAMRFTDCSRLAVFGNVNNTNDTRRPGAKGDWTPSYLPDGLQTSRTAGAEYYYENRMKTFEWTSNFNAAHTDNHTVTSTSSESFLPANRAFTISESDSRNHAVNFNTSHSFMVNKSARHEGNVSFSYDKNRYITLSRAGEFGSDPYERISNGILDSLFMNGTSTLNQISRYRRSQTALSRGENWSMSAPYSLSCTPFKSRGIMDLLLFNVSGSYDKHTSHYFDNYDLRYTAAESEDDYRNRYKSNISRHYNVNASLAYNMYFSQNAWSMLTYAYSEDYRKGRNDLFRLDRLDGWGTDTSYPVGTLPSSSSEMQQALDIQNSEHSQLWKRHHQVTLRSEFRSKNKDQTTLVVTLPVRFELHHLRYDRNAQFFDLRRTKAFFVPNLYLHQQIEKGEKITSFTLNYALSRWNPDLVNSIEMVNDANPLYVQMGNTALKTSTTHTLTFNASTLRKWRPLYNLSLSYQRTHDALSTERTYNPQTGGYTTKPVNVNGNWRTDGSLSLNRQFGKQKNFNWASTTSYSFDHNVDMANVEEQTENSLSTIKSLYIREQFSLSYSKKGWNIGAKVRGSWNRLTGERSDFTDISAWDYNYGLNARIPLPLQIGLTTDFTVYSRRGYDDPILNTDNFVWNIRVERSVLNGNLTFMLDGFDLLHDLSKVTRTVNAQGRTESYTNVVPAYFMAHAIFRFNVQPKNKKGS